MSTESNGRRSSRHKSPLNLICLLPVRNGGRYLPAYLKSVASFARGIIALDDGSNDNTPKLLESHPIVKRVLSNPARKSYRGWNDGQNRQRLLDACSDFAPDWVLWLDADELIPQFDIYRLRAFVGDAADPHCAYGLEVLRMIDGGSSFDKNKLWVYRLLGFRADMRLSSSKFHADPIPLDIPRNRWKRTRLRICHLSGTTSSRRRERYEKYREVDPNNQWQETYENLLEPLGYLWELSPLPPSLNVLID